MTVLRVCLAPRVSLLIAALAVGCSVGDSGSGFSSGPSLTFGGPGGDDSSVDSGTDDDSGGDSTDGCTPSEEVCNGLDDDCNGTIDDGDPDGGQACETGMPGECAAGTTVCEAGAVVCVPDLEPAEEVCDGLDNDCDGTVDNGDPQAGGACNTGMPGVCAEGTGSCAGGVLECMPTVAASAEACDGLDNDCDGTVDNGNPGGGGGCDTGMPGICGPGTQQCTGGALSCQQNQVAGAESCGNGLDDDCDGSTDEGCCAHDICLTGIALVAGCDPCVTQICAVDPFCCSTSWDGFCVNQVGSVCGLAC